MAEGSPWAEPGDRDGAGYRECVEPLRFNLAGQVAEFYGKRLKWIEANRKGEAGMAEFRSSGASRAGLSPLAKWTDLRLYAARISFIALVLDSGSAMEQSADPRHGTEHRDRPAPHPASGPAVHRIEG